MYFADIKASVTPMQELSKSIVLRCRTEPRTKTSSKYLMGIQLFPNLKEDFFFTKATHGVIIHIQF